MPKSDTWREFEMHFPILLTAALTSCETVIEIRKKRGPLAYFNNAFYFGVVAKNLKQLALECETYQGEANEQYRAKLFAVIKERFPNENEQLLSIISEHVLHLIFMNIGGGKALERALKEYDENKSE